LRKDKSPHIVVLKIPNKIPKRIAPRVSTARDLETKGATI
jgi:hypothetical protein